ncbi:MAG: hypothetical protein K9L22_04820 [Methylococcaceae bacterium]|nr:hypothetical protein [Methylococcaceae bacterium]
MKFGLACEGVTDQITLENILCGYFDNPDLDEEIGQLQPLYDETNQKQQGQGGWEPLLSYLKSSRFRDDVLNTEYVILQVDSDDSEHQNFGVAHSDADNQALSIEHLIENISIKLISVIDSGEQDFYATHGDKIIFAISVHSLECWLYAYYNSKALKKPKITGCYNALEYLASQKNISKNQPFAKNYHCYQQLSAFFLKRKNIEIVAQKDPSFNYFIQEMDVIRISNNLFGK